MIIVFQKLPKETILLPKVANMEETIIPRL